MQKKGHPGGTESHRFPMNGQTMLNSAAKGRKWKWHQGRPKKAIRVGGGSRINFEKGSLTGNRAPNSR